MWSPNYLPIGQALHIALLFSSLLPALSFQTLPIQRATRPNQLLYSRTALQQSTQSDQQWKPSIQNLSDRKAHFATQSHPPDNLNTQSFHHIEFYAGDASTFAKRLELALGIPITCWSSLSTGNDQCTTYGLECGSVRFMVTAPLSRRKAVENSAASSGNAGSKVQMIAPDPLPGYDAEFARVFYSKHGLAVRAVGVVVKNVTKAYTDAVTNGAVSILEPTMVHSYCGGEACELAEIQLYGDVVLRLVDFGGQKVDDASTPFLPHLAPYPYRTNKPTYGLTRIDHTVDNVPNLLATQTYIQKLSNYHPFAEFTPEDIGTVDSGLNSVVLTSENEKVLLPLNEPTEGKRKARSKHFWSRMKDRDYSILLSRQIIFLTLLQK